MHPHFTRIIGRPNLVRTGKHDPFALFTRHLPGHIIDPQNNILGGNYNRLPIGRGEDIVGCQHEHPGFKLGLQGEGQMHRHLVAVKVCVKRGADQGMKLNGLAFDEDRLKSLNSQPVKGRSTVEHHRILLDHVVQGVPHLYLFPFNHLFCAFNR